MTPEHWIDALRIVTRHKVGKIDRLLVYEAVQALLRGGLEGQSLAKGLPFDILNKSTVDAARDIEGVPEVKNFLEKLRTFKLMSIGVHVVDPIIGRVSKIWTSVKSPTPTVLARTELYASVWNRIYRQLFRPSATLINAIESGVLPWKSSGVLLRYRATDSDDSPAWYSQPFFKESSDIAEELRGNITACLPKDSNLTAPRIIEDVYQRAWNKLKDESFPQRLNRVATKFRDELIDKDDIRELFSRYLLRSGTGSLPQVLESNLASNPVAWDKLLDVVHALQSSILSKPEFCDDAGLCIYRIESDQKSPNVTSIYFVLGLRQESAFEHNSHAFVQHSLYALHIAIFSLLEGNNAVQADDSTLGNLVFKEINRYRAEPVKDRVTHDQLQPDKYGFDRWFCVVEKLMMEAKHEGHPVSYNVGYGSLAYAQSHLYQYELAPKLLSKLPGKSEGKEAYEMHARRISSYVKGFYSIFGNRHDRGLWFNEEGAYCGVFESASGRKFEETKLAKDVRSHHEESVLFAKILGVGVVDILDQAGNQITRVKDGKVVEMGLGDKRREDAMRKLLKAKLIPELFKSISEVLVNKLVEHLQIRTHGTSFILSFPKVEQRIRNYNAKIEEQTKTLVQALSRLEHPIATFEELSGYTESGSNGTFPDRHLDFLAELANLDGGLWLQVSEEKGLVVKAAQQFVPLIKLGESFRPLDLQMNLELLGGEKSCENHLPKTEVDLFSNLAGLKSFFAAINGRLKIPPSKRKGYVDALSFLHHSGTKTHSLWGMSLTAEEPCICVVISSDGSVYVFHDGREFTRLNDEKSN